MKKTIIITAIGAALLCVTPLSLQHSTGKGLALTLDSAQARIGRPLTPVSVAGAHRRYHRRAAYGAAAYGAAAYGYYGHTGYRRHCTCY